MTIRGFKDLEYWKLQYDDVVIFHVKDKQGEWVDLEYKVQSEYLMNITPPPVTHRNDVIFEILGLDPYDFCNKYYGYKSTLGAWPCYKYRDFEATTNVVRALYALIDSINLYGSVESESQSINYVKESIIKQKTVRIIKHDINSKLKIV